MSNLALRSSLANPVAVLPRSGSYNTWTAITLSILFWALFYWSVRLIFPSKSPEWCNRFVTFFHGIGAAFNGIQECFPEGKGLFDHALEPHTENHEIIFVVSLGYFMVDSIWCLYYQTESILMLSHHIFSVIALYRMLQKNMAGGQTVCALGGMEVTNPFLQARWFLRYEGYKESRMFTAIECIFAVLFFGVRLGFGTYFVINTTLSKNDLEYKILTLVLYIISVLFVLNIIQYMIYKYHQPKAIKESND